jgi:hypothetical protein
MRSRLCGHKSLALRPVRRIRLGERSCGVAGSSLVHDVVTVKIGRHFFCIFVIFIILSGSPPSSVGQPGRRGKTTRRRERPAVAHEREGPLWHCPVGCCLSLLSTLDLSSHVCASRTFGNPGPGPPSSNMWSSRRVESRASMRVTSVTVCHPRCTRTPPPRTLHAIYPPSVRTNPRPPRLLAYPPQLRSGITGPDSPMAKDPAAQE